MAALTNPTDLARETLKLLATRRIAPTPENYQRYYHEIAGTRAQRDGTEERLGEKLREAAKANPALIPLARLTRLLDEGDLTAFCAQLVAIASGRESGAKQDWGALLRELVRSLEARQTGGSLARKKDGLERVLIHFGTDPHLFDKLQGLLRSWSEVPEAIATVMELDPEAPAALIPASPALPTSADSARQIKELLAVTLEMGMAARLERFPQLADEARVLAHTTREARGADAWTRLAAQLRQFFFKIEVRGETDAELLDALLQLLGLLVNNIAELVEDDKWLSGQLAVIRAVINEPLTTERIAEAERRFKEVVYKQSMLKHSLREAKPTLKNLIGVFVSRLSEMTESTTDYHERVEGYAGRLEGADDIQIAQDHRRRI